MYFLRHMFKYVMGEVIHQYTKIKLNETNSIASHFELSINKTRKNSIVLIIKPENNETYFFSVEQHNLQNLIDTLIDADKRITSYKQHTNYE